MVVVMDSMVRSGHGDDLTFREIELTARSAFDALLQLLTH